MKNSTRRSWNGGSQPWESDGWPPSCCGAVLVIALFRRGNLRRRVAENACRLGAGQGQAWPSVDMMRTDRRREAMVDEGGGEREMYDDGRLQKAVVVVVSRMKKRRMFEKQWLSPSMFVNAVAVPPRKQKWRNKKCTHEDPSGGSSRGWVSADWCRPNNEERPVVKGRNKSVSAVPLGGCCCCWEANKKVGGSEPIASSFRQECVLNLVGECWGGGSTETMRPAASA